MKSLGLEKTEFSQDDETNKNSLVTKKGPNSKEKESAEEKEIENGTNGLLKDEDDDDGVYEKTDSPDSDYNEVLSQPKDVMRGALCSENEASKDSSVGNGPSEMDHSSNEDSCDGLNNNKEAVKKLGEEKTDGSIPTVVTSGDARGDSNDVQEVNQSQHSTNRRKASSRKSQPVRNVVFTEPAAESDYYDSDLEEYLSPIKTKPDEKKKLYDPQEKRRKSKRKRKLPLHHIDEDSDYFCIENFLNSNPEEQQLVLPPKEKKKKKRVDGEEVPTSPDPVTPKTMQNVALNLPNGMTRVVSIEMPKEGSDSNSMLCSLLTGKRYSSPGKDGKLKLITKDATDVQSNKDNDQVKKVRFSEDGKQNLVPKTVDDHRMSVKEDDDEGNVPLILENLLTSPHINKSCSLADQVPAVVENEVLDLSHPELDKSKMKNAHASVSYRAMHSHKPNKGSSNRPHNLNKKTLDGSGQTKDSECAEKGFSKTLLRYLTSGKANGESEGPSINVDQRQEFGGITVVLSGNSPTVTDSPPRPAATRTTQSSAQRQAYSGRNMYFAKSEYIDLNDLYRLQKGTKPSFEIEDSDDDNDVIILGEGEPNKTTKSSSPALKITAPRSLAPKSAMQKAAARSATIPSAPSHNKFPSKSGPQKSPASLLPARSVSVLKESTQAAGNVNNKHSVKHKKSPAKNGENKIRLKANNNKQEQSTHNHKQSTHTHTPQTKDAVDHSMNDGLIESISFSVSKLDADMPKVKPIKLKSLLAKQKSKEGNDAKPLESRAVNDKVKVDKAKVGKAVSLIKSKSPPSSKSQAKGANNRVYNSLLTGNTYVMKNRANMQCKQAKV